MSGCARRGSQHPGRHLLTVSWGDSLHLHSHCGGGGGRRGTGWRRDGRCGPRPELALVPLLCLVPLSDACARAPPHGPPYVRAPHRPCTFRSRDLEPGNRKPGSPESSGRRCLTAGFPPSLLFSLSVQPGWHLFNQVSASERWEEYLGVHR